jgi:transcriptional regulator with XRE-family HTH domain
MRQPLNGERLRLEIMKRGLDQLRFAQLCEVAPWTISQACSGRPINPKTFRKICSALAKTPAMFSSEELLEAQAAVGAR